MAYGGGVWLTQNKILPGSYVNFTSVARASATLSDRGVAAAPFTMSWGPVGEIRLVEQSEILKNGFDLFGYEYSAPEMLSLRELFRHAIKAFCYRLPAENAVKASAPFATAKYPGKRGNDIRILVDNDPDVTGGYVVTTMVGTRVVDTQKATTFSALADNDWVVWNKQAKFGTPEDEEDTGIYVTVTAGTPLAGGSDGEVSSGAHQAFLEAVEPYSFNTLCCPVSDEDQTTISLYVSFTKNQRDKVGAKFQTVCCKPASADYEGVIGVWNDLAAGSVSTEKGVLAYWVTGAECAANINESLTNTRYDGELTIDVGIKQSQLEQHIEQGHLVAHNNNGDTVVLTDINSLVTLKENFGSIFQKNQTVRVCDQIGNDIARLFNRRYLGIVQNDATGRASLWNDIVVYFRELERLRAITEFDDGQVTVEMGSNKDAVLVILNGVNIVNAMEKLYMAVVIQ